MSSEGKCTLLNLTKYSASATGISGHSTQHFRSMHTHQRTIQQPSSNYKSSSGDEIPERDVTYHLTSLLICHWTHTPVVYLPYAHLYYRDIRLHNEIICYMSCGRRLTKSALRMLLLFTFCVSSINCHLVCSFPIHKICPLCGIFISLSVLLTTETTMTLKSGFWMGQGHWKLHQWIPHVPFPISH